MNYFRKEGQKLICLLCSHYCHLAEGQKGICGINQHIDGVIKNLVFGYPAAMHVDPIEKKPLYHFQPSTKAFSLGTIGCNFKCPFCQNWSISQEKTLQTKEYFEPEEIVKLARKNGCSSIAYTYNEPTIFYPYAKEIALLAHKAGLKNIFVTNGFESKEVIEDMQGIIDAVNVDLKSFNATYYKKELGGDLEVILDNLKRFKQNNIWVEVTTLIVPTQNDSEEEIGKMARFIVNYLGAKTPWHLSAFHPDYKEKLFPCTPFDTLQKAYEIAKKAGLEYVYIGNVGFENETRCPECQTILIERSYFEVTRNNLVKGCCPKCQRKLEGVFSEN